METYIRSYGFVLATAAIVTVYACVSAIIDPWQATPVIVAEIVMPIALIMWVTFDARRRRATPCFDFGFLLYLCWYVAIPWYLLHTRGIRGWLTTLMFVGLLLVPIIAFAFAVVASMVVRSLAGVY